MTINPYNVEIKEKYKSIEEIKIPADDVERAEDFYKELFAWINKKYTKTVSDKLRNTVIIVVKKGESVSLVV